MSDERIYRFRFPKRLAKVGTKKLASIGTTDIMVATETDKAWLPITTV